jgi:hypothetical protein
MAVSRALSFTAFQPPALTESSYKALRHEYRLAVREDAIAAKREADFRLSPAGMVGHNVRRPDAGCMAWRSALVLQPLTDEQRQLIIARPSALTGRLPMGPKARAFFAGRGMDLNKRVALRRALRGNSK